MADAERTGKELLRASDLFFDILDVHVAARRSIILAATVPDAGHLLASQIAINERLRQGRAQLYVDDDLDVANGVEQTAKEEFERDFERLRRMTLISVCGALEYLAKAAYVDRAAQDPEAAATLLDPTRLKLTVAEVVGLDATERWYLVADRLFDHLGEQQQTRAHGERVRKLLTHFAPADEERSQLISAALSGSDLIRFNEAFVVRNCLVHNGARVSATLARLPGYARGAVIVLDRQSGPALMRAVQKVAIAIRAQALDF